MTDEELAELEDVASPGAGACGAQFTANTMACAFEALGISAGGSAMVPAEDDEKATVAERIGELVMKVLAEDLRPSRIITRESLENAIADRLRVRRLDQRRPPPARRRQGGRRAARDGRLRADLAPDAAVRRHEARAAATSPPTSTGPAACR